MVFHEELIILINKIASKSTSGYIKSFLDILSSYEGGGFILI